MATTYEPLSLAERGDIHKSCKSLETLLNVLNDYCEAIGNVGALQKKLAKSLRETAGMKITGEIAANAMNASAIIFEALSDIDAKFAKIADKEYDGISTEVKKWFKKLAKEEKTHDEKMANANAKIKQAGQIYEKKSKKGARDIAEEHARYVNLISMLGPEMSQEKYNHAVSITQRHTSTTYSAAACLSRVADAEWIRAFEGIRRFAPVIGQLGEWRALCEGGWTGPLPQSLPDLPVDGEQPRPYHEEGSEKRFEDDQLQVPTTARSVEARELSRERAEQGSPQLRNINKVGQEHSEGLFPLPSPRQSPLSRPSQPSPSSESLVEDRLNNSMAGPADLNPPRPFAEHNSDSVRSLSAFPSPPTHFPLPPPRQQQSSQSQSSQSSSYPKPRLTESPLPEENYTRAEISSAPLEPRRDALTAQQKFQEQYPPTDRAQSTSNSSSEHKANNPIAHDPQPSSPSMPSYSPTQSSTMPGGLNSRPSTHARGNNMDGTDDREFGVNLAYRPKARTMDNVKSASIERADTTASNGSVIAAMRHRYAIAAGSSSVAPKDVPRLPLSVNDLAIRYQPADGPSSPRAGPSSPSPPRQLPSVPTTSGTPRQPNSYQQRTAHSNEPSPLTASAPPIQEDGASDRRRRQRVDEVADTELKEKQVELRERELDIEVRMRELERDRLRLMSAQEEAGPANPSWNDGSRRIPESQVQPLRPLRPRSQLDLGQASANASNNLAPLSPVRSRLSHSTTHLIPPSPSANSPASSDPRSGAYHFTSSSRPSSQQHEDKPPHATSCGCETCSVVKYRTPSSAQPFDLRPQTQPLTLRPVEKSKPGWIRRLSVPVGNAFSMDSKKSLNNLRGLGSGKNGSTASFGSTSHQDGRRSYDASFNRSMTNLGIGGR